MAAAREETKVRIKESPELARLLEQSDADKARLQARVYHLEKIVDQKTQENALNM